VLQRQPTFSSSSRVGHVGHHGLTGHLHGRLPPPNRELDGVDPQVAGRRRRGILHRRLLRRPSRTVLLPAVVRGGAARFDRQGPGEGRRLARHDAAHGHVLLEGRRAHAGAHGRRCFVDGCGHDGRGFLRTVYSSSHWRLKK
jgi:hypothetical protein